MGCCIRCCVLMSWLGAAMPLPGMGIFDAKAPIPLKFWDMLVGR